MLMNGFLGLHGSPANVTDDWRIVTFAAAMKIAVPIVKPTMRASPEIQRRAFVAALAGECS
jgi:hypothetical protein